MNRFILADDPYDIPTVMCDQHIIKMITEEAQMLCYAIQKHMPEFAACHSKTLFKTTPNSGYAKHPCTQWCATNQTNFEWALDLFQEMCGEYSVRFNGVHGTDSRLKNLFMIATVSDEYDECFPKGKRTSHPQCFGAWQQQCQTSEWWPVQAYRTYYRHKQMTFKQPMRWTSQPQPSFM